MGLEKCPRCELNYIRPGEQMCGVCARELNKAKGQEAEEAMVFLCAECGEAPAEDGEELCAACLRERELQEEPVSDALLEVAELDGAPIDDPAEDLQEIALEEDSDIPDSELKEIAVGLSDGEEEYSIRSIAQEQDQQDIRDVAV